MARRRQGRQTWCRLEPEALRRATDYLEGPAREGRSPGGGPLMPGRSDSRLTEKRTVKAPRERVFRAWTDPGELARWKRFATVASRDKHRRSWQGRLVQLSQAVAAQPAADEDLPASQRQRLETASQCPTPSTSSR